MGPPPFGGGNWAGCNRCGHVWSILQWGHRLSVVETWTARPESAARFSDFNGATAFRWWKPALQGEITAYAKFLQSGHRLSVVETYLLRNIHSSRYIPSMGPPPFGGGNADVPVRLNQHFPPPSMGPPPFGGGNGIAMVRHIGRPRTSMGPPPFGGGNLTPPVYHKSANLRFNEATAFRWWKPALAPPNR